jgi:hypothetical protein
MAGLPRTENPVQAASVPYAARYMNCGDDAKQVCGEKKYETTCWLPLPNRSSIVPPTNQGKSPHGQAGWHPGNR